MHKLIGMVTKISVACLLVLSTSVYAADPGRGPDLFQKNCRPCHSVDKGAKPDMYGFNLTLYGINGRPAAAIDGFFYSEAMRESGIVWNEEKLRVFLTDPELLVPDNRMVFFGLNNEQDLEDLIAFLIGLGD